MTHPTPHRHDRPVRVLFVFATLDGALSEAVAEAEAVAEVGLLAQSLDRLRYRIDGFACARPPGAAEPLPARLAACGIDLDSYSDDLSFDDRVRYLARKLAGYEIVVACQTVPDLDAALASLRHRPVRIDRARCGIAPLRAAPQAPAGDVGDAGDVVVREWRALFDAVLQTAVAPPARLFRSFLQGGFEASTHRLHTGRRLDVIAATGHDVHAEADYRQLGRIGMRTVRDGLRWHLIETQRGRFDFSSFVPMLRAAQRSGTQVIWDLMHYGWPDDIDIWTPGFVDRFAAFARATARLWRDSTDEIPFWCPINEISFFSWGGGDVRYLNPFASGRGFELKVQLARASIAAIHALRDIDARARFVQCEPLIAIHHDPATGLPAAEAEGWHQAQFQAYELLRGQIWPQIGGDPSLLDIIGVNYYPRNQWIHGGAPVDVDHRAYRPLSDLLFETYARYQRPIFVSETGVEDDRRAPWFRYVAAEVARARQRGVPVEGLCLYPVLNHPGWDDDRACQNGLLTQAFAGSQRGVDPDLLQAVIEEAHRLSPPHHRLHGGSTASDASPRRSA